MYEKIAEYFISLLYSVLFGKEPPCMSERARNYLHDIKVWFLIGEITYITFFDAYK